MVRAEQPEQIQLSLQVCKGTAATSPPALPVCWTVQVLLLSESLHPGEGPYLCMWSLFSVSTQRLWTQVKGWEKDWAVKGKLWVRARCSALSGRSISSTIKMSERQPVSEMKSTASSAGCIWYLKALNWFYLFRFFTLLPFPLQPSLKYFETNPCLQQPLKRKKKKKNHLDLKCAGNDVLFCFQNERAALWNLISHAGRIVYFCSPVCFWAGLRAPKWQYQKGTKTYYCAAPQR